MMKLGLISDIHADARSLQLALDLLVSRGVHKILCAGDLVEKGPDGDEVTHTVLQQWLIPTVQGNHDLNAVRNAAYDLTTDEPPLRPDEVLMPQSVALLDALPMTRHYLWEGTRVLLAHGTPTNRETYLFAHTIPKRFKRSARRLDADVLVLGHTHRPMRLFWNGLWIFNPGSVCRGRRRDSHTCATLTLPGLDFEVFDLATGDPVTLED